MTKSMDPPDLLLHSRGRGWMVKAAAFLFAIAMAMPAVGVRGDGVYPFAMCSNGNIVTSPAYPTALLDAGARMVRTDFTFPVVRPTSSMDPNTWNWKSLDAVVRLRAQYPQLQWYGLLGYGADWAKAPNLGAVGQNGLNAPEAGIEVMPASDPRNYYGNYVFETVRRYHGAIHVWESWNEPDLPGGPFFIGNGADFEPYQKACYLAAKSADPSCTVVFAAMTYANVEGYLYSHGLKPPSPYPPRASFFEQYLQAVVKDPDAKRNNYYFDVMNQHSYSRATDLYDYTMVDRKLMRDYLGVEKPVWITEMGIEDNAVDGPTNTQIFGCTPDEYCDYILQAYAWGKLAGVRKFFHFQLDNSNGLGLYGGMLGDPKPALATYRDLLVKEFADADLVAERHGNAGVGLLAGNSPYDPSWRQGYDLFEFTADKGRKHIWMAFTDTAKDADIQLPATRQSAILIDRHGNRTAITATGGFYDLHLAGATNTGGWPAGSDPAGKALGQPEHLVGGATEVLVEGE